MQQLVGLPLRLADKRVGLGAGLRQQRVGLRRHAARDHHRLLVRGRVARLLLAAPGQVELVLLHRRLRVVKNVVEAQARLGQIPGLLDRDVPILYLPTEKIVLLLQRLVFPTLQQDHLEQTRPTHSP